MSIYCLLICVSVHNCCVVFTDVCVAGNSLSKSEILELCLPQRLFAQENKVQIQKRRKCAARLRM